MERTFVNLSSTAHARKCGAYQRWSALRLAQKVLQHFLPQTCQRTGQGIGQSHPPFVFHFMRCKRLASIPCRRICLDPSSAPKVACYRTPSTTVMLSGSSFMRAHNSFWQPCALASLRSSPQRRLFEAIAHFKALLEPSPGWLSLLPTPSRQHQRAIVRGSWLNFQRVVGTGGT